MLHIDVPVPDAFDWSTMTDIVSAAIDEAGLTITLKSTLATFPGSLHWHLKQGKHPGTLEITWQPGQRRFWLSVQSRRDASWIAPAVTELQTLLATRLALRPSDGPPRSQE